MFHSHSDAQFILPVHPMKTKQKNKAKTKRLNLIISEAEGFWGVIFLGGGEQ